MKKSLYAAAVFIVSFCSAAERSKKPILIINTVEHRRLSSVHCVYPNTPVSAHLLPTPLMQNSIIGMALVKEQEFSHSGDSLQTLKPSSKTNSQESINTKQRNRLARIWAIMFGRPSK